MYRNDDGVRMPIFHHRVMASLHSVKSKAELPQRIESIFS
jgi:hypothetical protein